MTLDELFKDKTIKSKAKVAIIGDWLLSGELSFDELLAFTETQGGANMATCIEALEYTTKKDFALAEILKLRTDHNKSLVPQVEKILEKEEDNGVKKKYVDALNPENALENLLRPEIPAK